MMVYSLLEITLSSGSVILLEMSVEITCLRAEKLLEIVRQLDVKHLGLSLGVITASFGVVVA